MTQFQYFEKLKRLGGFISDLVFPVSCLVCGKDGLYLCAICQTKLAKLDKQQCLVCQKPVPFGKTHPECVTRNTVDGIISALPYQDRFVKKIIEVFKYNFVSDLAQPLSELLFEEIQNQNLTNYFSEFILIPVPLHQRRENWRGFNQSLLLAHSLKEKLNCSLNENLVNRIRYTEPQVNLNQSQRQTNIADAFSILEDVVGKKFLIIDDVVTTGSTINEIAKLLKKQKAAEVWGLTAARG